MIKFAFSRPAGKVFYILLFIILTKEFFGKQASDYFQNPIQKCWELNDSSIDSFASDNETLILSQTDGNILRIDKYKSDQIWKTSVGNKGSSTIKLNKNKISIVTLEENSDSKNMLVIRDIDGLSGVVEDLKEFPDVFRLINSDNSEKNQIFYVNSRSEIVELNLENKSLNRFPNTYNIGENTILSGDEKYFAFADNSEITSVKLLDHSERQTIKSDSQRVVAITNTNDSLFWGDDSGKVFQKTAAKKGFEKILRTGGKISFLQDFGEYLLITSNDNYLYFYSLKNRKLVWKKRLSGRITVKPQFQENMIIVTTNAESDLYFINSENGKTFNQISLPRENFIKEFQIDKSSLFVQTNFGLSRFSENCDE